MDEAEAIEIVERLHIVNALLHDARARGGIDGTEEAAARRHLRDAALTIQSLVKALEPLLEFEPTRHDFSPLAKGDLQFQAAMDAFARARTELSKLKSSAALSKGGE